MSSLTRRFFLSSAITTGLIVATASGKPARANHHIFQHSVASADPLPTSVILWTRATPRNTEALIVTWEISRSESFNSVVQRGMSVAKLDDDHTVHVEANGLDPGTTYFYRFHCEGQTSPIGRTATAPLTAESLTFAICSCANWESGFFNAYRDIAHRDEIDVVIHLGDYIYEYGVGEMSGKLGPLRHNQPEWECTTLADYRLRYATYRTDPDLQAAHANHPWIVTWDDHEMADNAHTYSAENHQPHEGDWSARKAAALKAYFEWLPIRSDRLFRHFNFGNLLDLIMLDLRSYRAGPGSLPLPNQPPPHNLVGEEQFQWVSETLANSTAQWTVLGNSVMLAQLQVASVPAEVQPALRQLIHPEFATTVNSDMWDGYRSDRQRLLDLLAHKDGRVLIFTGDLHSEWANEILHNGKVVAFEMVGSSISAPNVDDRLFLPEVNPLSQTACYTLHQANPHIKHVELDAHGYAMATITPTSTQLRWMRVADKANPASPVAEAKYMEYFSQV